MINFLKVIQPFFLVVGILGMILIFSKFGQTTSCAGFAFGYYLILVLFSVSLLFSFLIYKKSPDKKRWPFFVPLTFLFAFLLLGISQKNGWVKIYEQHIGGCSCCDFSEKGPHCNSFFIRLFKNVKLNKTF